MARLGLTRRRLMHWGAVGAAGALLGPGLELLRPAPGAAASSDLTIATPADQEPASLDGQVDPYQSAWLYNSFVTDPLVVLSSTGKYLPNLATAWNVSSQGRIWTLSLRQGVTFQDGTPFDSEAVQFNIERVMNPATHSALMANYLGVKNFLKAEAPDKNTVELIYSAPVPALLYGLSICPLWSPAAVRQYGTTFQQHLVGEGAFKLAEWVRGDHVRFVKNPAYRGGPPAQNHAGAAYLDSITIKFVGDPGVLGQVLKTNEVQMVAGLPAQALPTYQQDPNFQVIAGYQPGNGLMFTMNTSRPGLSDVRVRRALRYAYDQDKMNQTLYNGTYTVVKGPLTKYTLYYWKGAERAYAYDPAKAKAMLDDAGWKVNGSTGVREQNGKPLALTMIMLHHQEIGEYLSAQFRQIGVSLTPQVVPGPVQLQRAQSGDFDLIYERLRSYEPDILYDEYYSKNAIAGGWAWSRFQNPGLDKILLDSQGTTDPAVRQTAFTKVQEYVTDQALYLPTLDDPQLYVMPKSVKGFRLGAVGGWYFLNDMRLS
jgi:peptide/nickel transport system substrate-binding protein